MKFYTFNLILNGSLVGEGYGNGSNLFDAFERAVEEGTVILPISQEIEVVASNGHLQISFSAHKSG